MIYRHTARIQNCLHVGEYACVCVCAPVHVCIIEYRYSIGTLLVLSAWGVRVLCVCVCVRASIHVCVCIILSARVEISEYTRI